jgi:hypothetical protein
VCVQGFGCASRAGQSQNSRHQRTREAARPRTKNRVKPQQMRPRGVAGDVVGGDHLDVGAAPTPAEPVKVAPDTTKPLMPTRTVTCASSGHSRRRNAVFFSYFRAGSTETPRTTAGFDGPAQAGHLPAHLARPCAHQIRCRRNILVDAGPHKRITGQKTKGSRFPTGLQSPKRAKTRTGRAIAQPWRSRRLSDPGEQNLEGDLADRHDSVAAAPPPRGTTRRAPRRPGTRPP